jgi:CubicO group peptidase (beta-lactamase class C family)
MADLDHDPPITPQTVFHVASISKQFTAAAILLLEQEGKLSLDDDVHKYIKDLPDFGCRSQYANGCITPVVCGINGSCWIWRVGGIRST